MTTVGRGAVAPRHWRATAIVVATMCVALYAVPLALADRLDPRVSLLALMAVDALLLALLVRTGGSLWTFVALAALLAASVAGRAAGWFALPSIAMFGALAAGFGWTLRAGAVPLVTAIARGVHGSATTPALERYTRGLTAAWTGVFALLAVGSAVLAWAAPFAVWSLFVNLLSWPLIGATFVAEWLVRRLRFPELPPSTPAQVIAAAMRWSAGPRDRAVAEPAGRR